MNKLNDIPNLVKDLRDENSTIKKELESINKVMFKLQRAIMGMSKENRTLKSKVHDLQFQLNTLTRRIKD